MVRPRPGKRPRKSEPRNVPEELILYRKEQNSGTSQAAFPQQDSEDGAGAFQGLSAPASSQHRAEETPMAGTKATEEIGAEEPHIASAQLMMQTSAQLVEIVGSLVDIGDVTCLLDSGSMHSFVNPRVLSKSGAGVTSVVDSSAKLAVTVASGNVVESVGVFEGNL